MSDRRSPWQFLLYGKSVARSTRCFGDAVASERRFTSLTVPGSSFLWLVSLTADARVKDIKHEALRQLLSDMEALGRRSAHNLGDYRDAFVRRLRALRIESVYAVEAKAATRVP